MGRFHMFSTIVLITIVLFCNYFVPLSASNLKETSLEPNKLVLEVIEKFRQQMPKGFPPFDLPVLAPFTWKEFHINELDNNIFRLKAKLKEGITRGLDQFNVTVLNVQIAQRKLHFQLTFPSLQTQGHYVAKGQLAGFVPFERSGKCSLQLHGLNMYGTVEFDFWRKYLFVRDLNVSFAVKSGQVQFEKVMLLPWNTALFNRILSGQIPDYLRNNRNGIAMQIRVTIKPKINKMLWKYNVHNILQMANVTACTG